MKLKILRDDRLEEEWGVDPLPESVCPNAHERFSWVLESQARLTLQQVVEWGKEPCPHPGMVDHSPFGLLVILRRECPECRAELEEMCNE